jgi:hypothetical protein
MRVAVVRDDTERFGATARPAGQAIRRYASVVVNSKDGLSWTRSSWTYLPWSVPIQDSIVSVLDRQPQLWPQE